MSFVGIIANPASGKDVRRVASHAIAANNYQKTNIVRRLLVALAALNVGRVEIMPDPFGIGLRALEGLARQPDIQAITSLIDMPVTGGEADTLHAARHLCETGAGCLIVLGGDGTCRVAAKGCGGVPMLPISTGTNNVVPYFVEGTAAGLAAAYVARRPDTPRERLCYRHKRLVVAVNRDRTDQALVDVALLASRFTGSRAVWDAGELRQVFVTRAGPFNIGISSVVGVLHPVGRDHPGGAMAGVAAGPGAGRRVVAPIAPANWRPSTSPASSPCSRASPIRSSTSAPPSSRWTASASWPCTRATAPPSPWNSTARGSSTSSAPCSWPWRKASLRPENASSGCYTKPVQTG